MIDRKLLTPQLTKPVDEFCVSLIEERQTNSFDPAHGTLNLTNVALLTDAWGIVYKLTASQRRILRVAGFLHDIERSPTENQAEALRDEEFSARIAGNCLLELNKQGLLVSSPRQRNAVKYAIANHGTSPWIEDPSKTQKKPTDLKETFRETLYLADKMEQLDLPPAVLRRAMFVSGKRLAVGDLQEMGLNPNSDVDRIKAFLQESIIRVTFVNPEASFPKWIQDIIRDLYKPQKEFIEATSRTLGLHTTGALAEMVMGLRNSQGKSVLDKRGIKITTSELTRAIEEAGGLTDKGIQGASDDKVTSAQETILYLSSQWQNSDLKGVIENWNPNNNFSQVLRAKCADYVSGKWATDMQQQILLAA